mgnify:CR=1 FL=1
MRSIINEILTEGRVEDAKEFISKNFAPDEDNDYSWVVDYLDDNDPSGNNKYLMVFLLKEWLMIMKTPQIIQKGL